MLLFSPAFCFLKSRMLWQTNLPFSPSLFFSLPSLQPFDIFITFVSLLISQNSLGEFLAPDSKPQTSYYPEGKFCLQNIISEVCGCLFSSFLRLGPSNPGCLSHFPCSQSEGCYLLFFFTFQLTFPFVLTRIIGLVQATSSQPEVKV